MQGQGDYLLNKRASEVRRKLVMLWLVKLFQKHQSKALKIEEESKKEEPTA